MQTTRTVQSRCHMDWVQAWTTKTKRVGPPHITYDTASMTTGVSVSKIAMLVSFGIVAGSKKGRKVSLSSLIVWKELQEEKKQRA